MKQQLIATIKTNLLFYRRNGVLIGVGLFLLFFYGLSMLPFVFFTSSTQRFEIVKRTFINLNDFIIVFTGLLGLLTLSYHRSNRCLKMIFTKPCLPETWLLGTFISAMVFSLILYGIIFLIAFLSFPLFGVSFTQGLLYLSFYHFLIGLNVYAILTFLTIIMHPILAAIVALLMNEGTFYGLLTLVMGGLKASPDNRLLVFLKYIFYSIYFVVPQYSPFKADLQEVYETFRVTSPDLTYLFYALIYTLIFSSFCFFLTTYVLKKKRLI